MNNELYLRESIKAFDKETQDIILLSLGLDTNVRIPTILIAKKYNYSTEKVRRIIKKLFTIKLFNNQTIDSIINEINKERISNNQNLIIDYKAYELINSIHELKRLPKKKENNNGIIEKYCFDNTEQASHYNVLRKEYLKIVVKIKKGEFVTERERCLLRDYLEIKKILELYSKRTQLIESINELRRVPKNSITHNFSEKSFYDGSDQGYYYFRLRSKINKILQKIYNQEKLLEYEEEYLDDYFAISETLDNYSKKKEFIQMLKDGIIIPTQTYKNHSSVRFSNGQDPNNYYRQLILDWKKIQGKLDNNEFLKLSEIEQVQEYIEVRKVIDDGNKIEQLINFINQTRNLPLKKYESTFQDGTDQHSFYIAMRRKINKIKKKQKNNIQLTDNEIKTLEDYKRIMAAYHKYSKRTQLIKTIHELKRAPKLSEQNNNKSERVFEDGTDQANYYFYLRRKMISISKKIDNQEELSLDDEETLEDYQIIKETLDLYSRKTQFIETLHKNKKIPKQTKKGENETFIDGSNQAQYYHYLKSEMARIEKKIKQGETLSFADKERLEEIKEVEEVVNLYSKKSKFINYINTIKRRPMYINEHEQMKYYKNLEKTTSKLLLKQNKGIILTPSERIKLRDFQEIENVISFYTNTQEENIKLILDFCKNNNIDISINKELINKPFYELYVKICFLKDNNIPITDKDGFINPIMYQSEINMQSVYNTTLDELVNRYIDGHVNSTNIGLEYKKM